MIELKNISKYYGENIIFSQYSVKIEKGSMNAIVGESGSGKSTILNIIGLLEDIDDGDIYIDDVIVKINTSKAIEMLRYKISYLFQNYALVDTMNVEDNLKIALEYKSLGRKQKKEEIQQALSKVGLKGYEKRKIYTLSGGQQQRVAFARVLLKNSDILLCDEPTGSLDKENANMIMKLLKGFHNDGKTIIIVTHDEEIAKQCQQIITLDNIHKNN